MIVNGRRRNKQALVMIKYQQSHIRLPQSMLYEILMFYLPHIVKFPPVVRNMFDRRLASTMWSIKDFHFVWISIQKISTVASTREVPFLTRKLFYIGDDGRARCEGNSLSKVRVQDVHAVSEFVDLSRISGSVFKNENKRRSRENRKFLYLSTLEFDPRFRTYCDYTPYDRSTCYCYGTVRRQRYSKDAYIYCPVIDFNHE